jgi:EAL and modified HD-GYP domain-containing signal transduction protein
VGETSVATGLQSSAYVCLRQMLDGGKKIVVDFTEKSILENLPYALPPALAVVKVPERVLQTPSIVDLLSGLKADGYLIAVDGFSGNPDCGSLYGLADIVSIDVAYKGKDAIEALLVSARQYKASLLAARVQDQAQVRVCQELGFTLFHGPFFKSPDRINVRKLSSNEILRFNLIKLMESNEPDFAHLSERIQADPTISFRLLAYLNSSAFSLSQKIKSIPQATTLLGWRNVRNWLRVVLLTEMSSGKDAHELVLLSAQRGFFLELIAYDHDYWGFEPESLHLLGIFSLLDALLGVAMSEIVANLPLDNKMKAALCREPNNEYSPLLQVAQYLEEARWEEGERLIEQLNLDSRKVHTAFQASVNWASQLDSLQPV